MGKKEQKQAGAETQGEEKTPIDLLSEIAVLMPDAIGKLSLVSRGLSADELECELTDKATDVKPVLDELPVLADLAREALRDFIVAYKIAPNNI